MPRNAKALLLIAALFAPASPAHSQESGASWLRTKPILNPLNPKISLIGDFVGQSGPSRGSTKLSLREVELGLQSEVDPFVRADVFIAKPDGKAVEVEEGYATLLALPGRLQLRGGKFNANFGKLNLIHHPERPQVDGPLALDKILGDEGLNDTGVEISRIFAPFDLFTEVTYAFLNGVGEEPEKEPATANVALAGGGQVTVKVHEPEAQAPRKFRDFAHVARARVYADLTDAANLELGVSGATHQPQRALHRQMLGLDLTCRWKPAKEGLYRSFIWRSEFLLSRRRLPDAFDATGAHTATAARTERRGGYTYAEYQADRRWRLGLRADYTEDPQTRETRSVTRALSPYATFTMSEFNRLRLQFERQWLPTRRADNLVFLQWTIVLGPHGAHPF